LPKGFWSDAAWHYAVSTAPDGLFLLLLHFMILYDRWLQWKINDEGTVH